MSTTANRYALALLEAGCPQEELHRTADYLTGSAPLWDALCNPSVAMREKAAVLRRLPDFTENTVLQRFYRLLAEKGRFPWLGEIVRAYDLALLRRKGETLCTVRCAREPDDESLSRAAKVLCKKHGCRAITFEIVQDASVLGGFVFEIDGVTYDKSVSGQLRALAHSLQER